MSLALGNTLREGASFLRAYVGGGYPAFIYPPGRLGDELPVFFYHGVDGRTFERHLQYLQANGYRTVACDEAVELAAERRSGGRAVMLTFDDGLASVYLSAFPLARRHGVRIVLYIVPSRIGRPGFLTWEQCRAMHRSGLVDIQSHSYAHKRVVTALAVQGILNGPPADAWGVPGLDPIGLPERPAHLPVFEAASLFEASRAYRLPAAFWEDWLALQRREGASRARALRGRLLELLEAHARGVQVVDGEALRREIREDLESSRACIEDQLPGHRVRHFAYPWHRHGPAAWMALEAAGFRSAAIGLGIPEGRKPAGLAESVLELRRVNADFLLCLPGRGRTPFRRVLAGKAMRRFRSTNRGGQGGHV
ncbi:MAG TPA: polysaccharide deacetylase family protein [Longimicrobiales bacterium]